MLASTRHSLALLRSSAFPWLRALAETTLLCASLWVGALNAQIGPLAGYSTDGPASVSGRVLNRVTHEPISRALVYSPGNQYATLTDDRGHFEFKLPEQIVTNENTKDPSDARFAQRIRGLQNEQPAAFFARKPGFLPSENEPPYVRSAGDQSEITLYLTPESLIVGHVAIPGSEGDVRIRLELYRRESEEGQPHWRQAGSIMTWADGEFRFAELAAGTYKLGTTEELDRDPTIFTVTSGEPLFGYPPIFYPASTDFSAATSIQLAAGATFQATLSPPRREYFSVKLPVGNVPTDQPMDVRVYPLGHPGPGYSLGYDPAERMIEGMLPNGSYTVRIDALGQPGWMGMQNFAVSGAPTEGTGLNLVLNSSLNINVKEELQSGQNNFQELPVDRAGTAANSGSTRRVTSAQVNLFPIEDFSSAEAAASQQVGDQAHSLFIHNVRPGQYRVEVQSAVGYAASVSSSGTDLLREPLVVGMGGANPPIEVTLRDDGAEVKGTIEEDAVKAGSKSDQGGIRWAYPVYFIPIGGGAQFRQTVTSDSRTFTEEQLPPGNYRVLVFDRQQRNLEYASEETLRKFESKGQDISVDAGQKLQMRVKVIPGSDLP